jgi:hypothetical protein
MGTKAVITGCLTLAAALAARGPVWAQESKPSGSTRQGVVEAGAVTEESGREVDRLVGQLRKHPAEPSKADERHGLYLTGVDGGEVTLVAEEPVAGLYHCGSARWSRDGKRIYFDATPGTEWNRTHLMVIERVESGPKLTDLGPGNCPSPSPDGKRVTFLLNPDAVPNAEAGVWVMDADGTGRRQVGSYGRPLWSPDGRQILIIGFSNPPDLTLMDAETWEERPATVPGRQVYSVPGWAADHTIVAALGAEFGDTLALLDATDPDRVKVKEVLWETGKGPDVNPTYPVYSPANGCCVFASAWEKGMTLYSFRKGSPAPPRRLETGEFEKPLVDLALSPDGRYVLFCGGPRPRKAP